MRKLPALCLSLSFITACHTARTPPSEAIRHGEPLRERVARVREDPAPRVRGELIGARRALFELYEHRGFAPAWTSGQARAELLRAIRDSADEGLAPADYHLAALERLGAESARPGAAEDLGLDYELLQSDALALLLAHLSSGKLDPDSATPRSDPAPDARLLQAVIGAPSLYAAVERAKPQHEMYRNLCAALARYRTLRSSGGWQPVPDGPPLAPGARDPRVPALRARLAATGELVETPGSADPLAFDGAVAAALRNFQRANGLDADAVVRGETLAALNRPIDARIAQIEVNLERGRWLLQDLDPTFVVVNVAGFRIYYLRDRELVWSARVQVGQPFRQTPMFRSRIGHLVLNPTWTVPPIIFAEDLLPALRRDPDTLAKRGLRVVDLRGQLVNEPIDWAAVTPDDFPYLLRHDPGPDNPLGRVKFMFPNPYSVYLHDTPNQALFEKSERTFSSGCIRVERARELAALLLEGQAGLEADALEREIATGETRSVTLERRVPVLVSYWTAWVDRDGVLQFRSDVYGLDARVRAGLDTPVSAPGAQ